METRRLRDSLGAAGMFREEPTPRDTYTIAPAGFSAYPYPFHEQLGQGRRC